MELFDKTRRFDPISTYELKEIYLQFLNAKLLPLGNEGFTANLKTTSHLLLLFFEYICTDLKQHTNANLINVISID